VERRRQHHSEDRVPLVVREILHGRDVLDPRVVHQNIQPAAHGALGAGHHGAHLAGPAQVGGAEVDAAAVFAVLAAVRARLVRQAGAGGLDLVAVADAVHGDCWVVVVLVLF